MGGQGPGPGLISEAADADYDIAADTPIQYRLRIAFYGLALTL